MLQLPSIALSRISLVPDSRRSPKVLDFMVDGEHHVTMERVAAGWSVAINVSVDGVPWCREMPPTPEDKRQWAAYQEHLSDLRSNARANGATALRKLVQSWRKA